MLQEQVEEEKQTSVQHARAAQASEAEARTLRAEVKTRYASSGLRYAARVCAYVSIGSGCVEGRGVQAVTKGGGGHCSKEQVVRLEKEVADCKDLRKKLLAALRRADAADAALLKFEGMTAAFVLCASCCLPPPPRGLSS